MTESVETTLWLNFVAGNNDGFANLYKHGYKSLYSYGIRCGMNPSQADDAIQDIFIKIYKTPSLIKNAFTIRPFLFRAIKNYSINSLKYNGKHTNVENLASDFRFTFDINEDIYKQEDAIVAKQRVEHFLSLLSPRQKEIIYLKFLLEMDYDAISEIMNISNQVARNLLSKAMKNLRDLSKDELPLFFILLQIDLFDMV